MKRPTKLICVIGLGQFGSELARELAKFAEVIALDSDEIRVNSIVDEVQRARILDAKDFAGLNSVVTADFDEAIVSLGESMEASILCTLHLKKIGIKKIRAKAVSEDHATILRSVGATETIFPERETARRIAAQIINPNLLDFIPLAEDFEVMDVGVPDSFHGKTLKELKLRENFGVFVIAVKELVPTRFVFLPGPDFIVKPSDILVMIGREADLERIQESASD
jgi:trk system potassium uptake protein